MKKVVMIALMALPIAGFSQAQISRADNTDGRREMRQNSEPSVEAIYVEVVTSMSDKEGQTVHIEISSSLMESLTDKEAIVQLKDLSGKSFATVPDAMAFLAGQNFKFVTSYQLPDKMGRNSAHILMEKRTLSRAMRDEIRQKEAAGTKPASAAPKK